MIQSASLPVRGFGVSTAKEVPEGTGRGDLCISGVEDHADVFGNNGRLDAVVKLQRGNTVSRLAKVTSRRENTDNVAAQSLTSKYADRVM